MINTNGIRSNGIHKQEIIDLLNNCDIEINVEDQIIRYYNFNKSKVDSWLGQYYLKTGEFYWSWYQFSSFFDNEIKDKYQLLKELLRPIFEEVVNRKVSSTKGFY